MTTSASTLKHCYDQTSHQTRQPGVAGHVENTVIVLASERESGIFQAAKPSIKVVFA
jgi:hypothetical protein